VDARRLSDCSNVAVVERKERKAAEERDIYFYVSRYLERERESVPVGSNQESGVLGVP